MKFLAFLSVFFSITFLCASLGAQANMDSGLYDPAPPEGSAFVRFINASGAEGAEKSGANGKGYMRLKNREISPYFVVKQGTADVSFGALKHSFEVKAGKFYTVVWAEDLSIIEDETNDNRAKSQILFYNLSARETLTLKTSDGSVAIVENVGKGMSGVRQINPVKIEAAVYEGDTKITDIEPLSLERGMAYSAIIFADSDDVVWVRSETNTIN